MKHPKQEHAQPHPEPGHPGRDTRPVKPVAGQTAHHLPAVRRSAGPVKGERPPEQESGRDVRRVKPAFAGDTGGPPEGPPTNPTEPPEGPPTNPTDQVPKGTGPSGEQYVRLRIRVRGDRLSVVDSHLVDGPLSQTTSFHGAGAYDVTYQDRLLHAGSVPDLGIQRSFPNLDGPAEQRGHHMTPREVTEFSARVPAGEVTAETIGGIRVRLHRLAEATSAPRLSAAPLAVQFEGQVTPTAELVGLPESALPEAIAARGARTGRAATSPSTDEQA